MSAFERWQARKGQSDGGGGGGEWMDRRREERTGNNKRRKGVRERARLGCSLAGRREKEERGKGNGD